jgi:hypothetical protein
MEQTTQETIQKPSLPIKTKIAAWLITIIGGLGILYFLYEIPGKQYLMGSSLEPFANYIFFTFIVFPFSLLVFIPGIFLLIKRKKWAWTLITVIISIPSILTILSFLKGEFAVVQLLFAPFVISFFLLLLDRKNF